MSSHLEFQYININPIIVCLQYGDPLKNHILWF